MRRSTVLSLSFQLEFPAKTLGIPQCLPFSFSTSFFQPKVNFCSLLSEIFASLMDLNFKQIKLIPLHLKQAYLAQN
jgi:hypothetical protein